jgi:hypothetical protein
VDIEDASGVAQGSEDGFKAGVVFDGGVGDKEELVDGAPGLDGGGKGSADALCSGNKLGGLGTLPAGLVEEAVLDVGTSGLVSHLGCPDLIDGSANEGFNVLWLGVKAGGDDGTLVGYGQGWEANFEVAGVLGFDKVGGVARGIAKPA